MIAKDRPGGLKYDLIVAEAFGASIGSLAPKVVETVLCYIAVRSSYSYDAQGTVVLLMQFDAVPSEAFALTLRKHLRTSRQRHAHQAPSTGMLQ